MSAIGAYWQRVQGLQSNVKWYLACTVLQSMAMNLSSLLFNLYLISLGFDAAFVGTTNALFSVAGLVSALPAGLLADRIGRKRAIILSLAGVALARLGLATFARGWSILGFAVLIGISSTLHMTSSAPFMTENSADGDRAMLFTLNSSLMNVAYFIAATVGGYLPGVFATVLHVGPESATAYRAAILVASCLTASALLPILAVRDVRGAVRRHTVSRSSLRFWRRFSNPKLLVKLTLPRVVTALGAGLVFPFLNLFFKQRFGISDATLGWIFGINSVLAAVFMLWGGTVAERLGKTRAMFYARALSIPGLIVIGFVPFLPPVVLAHWARSGLMRLGQPLYMAFAMEQLAEDERATGSSLMSTGWNVGWSVAPYISGLLQPRVGWGPLFVGTVIFYSLSLTLVYLFFVRYESNTRNELQRTRSKASLE